MILFEAIRQLKEGQAITVWECESDTLPSAQITWDYGDTGPHGVLYGVYGILTKAEIRTLARPKMTLEEGLERYLFDKDYFSDGAAERIARYLRSLPIDWQAEVDRKEGE